MSGQKKRVLITALTAIFVFGCTQKEDSQSITSPTPPVAKESVPTTATVPAEPELDRSADKLPLAMAWKDIWQNKDPFAALKAFQKKNGLPLETSQKMGEPSVLLEEGPCGPTFISMVKDSKNMIERVWEIDAKGKVLREWQPGTDKILRVEGNKLYRSVRFFELLSDYSTLNQKQVSEVHLYTLALSADGSMELFPDDDMLAKKWELEELTCPANLKIKSEYKYCVLEKKTKRLFVLQHPCT